MKYSFLFLLFVSQISLAQSICLYGTVYDHETDEPIAFASVFMLTDDQVLEGTYTDKHGNYFFCTDTIVPIGLSITAKGYDEAKYSEGRFMPRDSIRMDIPLDILGTAKKKETPDTPFRMEVVEILEIVEIIDRMSR